MSAPERKTPTLKELIRENSNLRMEVSLAKVNERKLYNALERAHAEIASLKREREE